MATFFDRIEPKLQPVPPKATDVEPQAFLLAIKQILPFFDMLGKPFAPVRNDINGNITALQKKYESDPEKFTTFRAMLEEEVPTNKENKKGPASVSLLWLKRALQYIHSFLSQVTEDSKCGAKTENLVPFCKKAYEDTLKNYHSWIIRKVFSMVSHAVPYRKDLMKTLSYGKEGLDNEVVHHMDVFVVTLNSHIIIFDVLLKDMKLDSNDKV